MPETLFDTWYYGGSVTSVQSVELPSTLFTMFLVLNLVGTLCMVKNFNLKDHAPL